MNRYGVDLSLDERLILVKVLLSHLADIHDIGVAHRDVSDHSIWLEKPSKVSLSGFVTAYFPEFGTVGGLRDALRAGKAVLPEDSDLGAGEASDPFRRDVYLLGVVAHQLLYLAAPSKESEIYVWAPKPDDPFEGRLADWFSVALDLIPADRFANARSMLNELNRIQVHGEKPVGIDMRFFEAFRTEVVPMVQYPIEENLKQARGHLYKSSLFGQPVSVKIWYGKGPDAKRPEEAHELQRFLEKARLLKSQPCSVLPDVVDFGLSAPGPYLVQRWLEGTPLSEVDVDALNATDIVSLCLRLVKATRHIHGLGFDHGDIHPSNVLIDTESIRFIDAIDLFPGAVQAGHTPAYVPVDYEDTPLDQRDAFAVAKICGELIDRVEDWGEIKIEPVRAEVATCLKRELKVYALDRIEDALQAIFAPVATALIEKVTVKVTRHTSAIPMIGDNDHFHIGVYVEDVKTSQRTPSIMVSVSGVRKRLLISLNTESMEPSRVLLQDVQHSQFVQAANKAVSTLRAAIEIAPGPADDVSYLLDMLGSMTAVQDAMRQSRARILDLSEDAIEEERKTDHADAVPRPAPATTDIWHAILVAEEATLPEVEIAGPVAKEFGRSGSVRIPYTNEGEALDYDPDTKVEALQEINGELIRVGELDIKETTMSVLVLNNPSFRLQQALGEKIKLRSQQDFSSFRRRRLAVNRILNRESVVPDLIDYFDPLCCPAPLNLAPPPTDADLDAYDRYDEDGRVVFTLNDQQREAFRSLWSNGPLSLLQGPPGTGKTSFIASFIHYALSEGAQSILLASQSHEAVNNAAEKVIELCQHTNLPLDLVRFGAEGMVSEQLIPHHASSILQAYRDLFRSEMRLRVGSLSRNLGLPSAFVNDWFDLDFDLGRLSREIIKLDARRSTMPDGSPERSSLTARLAQRVSRFKIIAHEKFGATVDDQADEVLDSLRADMLRRHSITSSDAIARVDQVIAIAREWVERLGTLRGNFEEFLAKTRSLVCGTCVGLGRSQFGVAANRYDWVIVDEAARATPGELAVAIQAGRRVLLVGDHRQLPPLYGRALEHKIASDLAWDDRSVLTRSDFERAFESDYGRAVGATLQTQYRMAPPIGELVSACFYPVALAPGRGYPKSWFAELPELVKSIVTWVDTSAAGRQSWERKRDSFRIDNLFEAREVLELLRSICISEKFINELLDDISEDEKPIGVICMYAEQKRLLIKMLSEQDWATGYRHLIKIDTVDSYQGKENRIIIVATTRNNGLTDQGFLKSPERINVAISRAMDRLIILGATRMWRDAHRDSPMGKVLAYIEANRDGINFDIVDAVNIGRDQA